MTETFDKRVNEKKICVVMSYINLNSEQRLLDSGIGVVLCTLLLELAQHPFDSFDQFVEHAKAIRIADIMQNNLVN